MTPTAKSVQHLVDVQVISQVFVIVRRLHHGGNNSCSNDSNRDGCAGGLIIVQINLILKSGWTKNLPPLFTPAPLPVFQKFFLIKIFYELGLKARETTNKIKCQPRQKQEGEG